MDKKKISKFGFIVHCRKTSELRYVLAKYSLSPFALFPEKLLKKRCLGSPYIEDIFTFRKVVSDKGAECMGKAFCIVQSPEQLLEDQTMSTELVKRACRMAQDWGAEMIGLGALCAVVGARGVEAAQSCSAAVTTGNSLTVYATIVCFEKIMEQLQTDPHSHKIVIVGFPGSIGLAITRILSSRGFNLVVVSRQNTRFLNRFLENMPSSIEVAKDLDEALKKSRVIFSATSAGNIIDPDRLLPGTVVFDIAQPKDVIYKKDCRKDVLIIDAGLISLPGSTTDKYYYSGLGVNDIPSCLGETMTLTLEKRWEQFSMGRELLPDKVFEIGNLSASHGFIFDSFRSYQKPIKEENIDITRKAIKKAI